MTPKDPLDFIIDKLKLLQKNGMDELHWYGLAS